MQVAIVLYPGFTALDFIGPYEILRQLPDAEVRFVWKETGPVRADSGVLLIGVTHTFDETSEPDVVLVPGGPGTAPAARDEAVFRHCLERDIPVVGLIGGGYDQDRALLARRHGILHHSAARVWRAAGLR